MAPVLRRDNSALNHGYTAEQQAHAIEALWALSGILILVNIFFVGKLMYVSSPSLSGYTHNSQLTPVQV
jgi:hypothetical protein